MSLAHVKTEIETYLAIVKQKITDIDPANPKPKGWYISGANRLKDLQNTQREKNKLCAALTFLEKVDSELPSTQIFIHYKEFLDDITANKNSGTDNADKLCFKIVEHYKPVPTGTVIDPNVVSVVSFTQKIGEAGVSAGLPINRNHRNTMG